MTTNTYDEIPYPSLVYTDTHPSKLATLARLFGLKPPPVATCRVLELGCGDGTNLIAIAQSLPQASLSGIDFSAKQIAMGQTVIEAIQLSNITLKPLDFEEMDESYGQFDYIIAHGLYSWVPKEQQNTILNLIQRHLAANGIAYISYNIYPGWHLENLVRDMMKYHTQSVPDMPFKLSMMQAKGIIQFLANLRQQGESAFDVLLQEKAQQLPTLSDNYLYHDFLEADNHSVYFHQFIKQASQHQLSYVTDIEFRHYLMLSFPPEVVEAMAELFQDDFFKKEQYLDFFYNRTLRRSLLCHQAIPVNRELDWQILTECYIAANLPSDNPTIKKQNQESTQFKTADGEIITIKHPLTQAAIRYLTAVYPHRVHFETLCQQVCQPLPQANQDLATLRERVAQELLHLYSFEAIELNIAPSPFVTKLSTYPTASPLARRLASQGQQPLINLRCEFINLNALATQLLPHLNGDNDSQALRALLKKILKKPEFQQLKKNNLSSVLEKALLEIAQGGLLIA